MIKEEIYNWIFLLYYRL